MSERDGVVVVGSGPSGVHAAAAALERGAHVTLVDVGHDDPATRGSIPDGTFSWLRANDPGQARYFVGDLGEKRVTGIRVGAQLTPPREFIIHDVERLVPFRSDTFVPLRSLARGGLGSGWGAGAYTYDRDELERAGLPAAEMRRWYDEVAREIGISGDLTSDIAPDVLEVSPVQPPAPLDTNARSLLAAYANKREAFLAGGFRLGPGPLAMLTEPLERDGDVRGAARLDDMDFYSDASRAVYRPRYTLERLLRNPRLRVVDGALALRFASTPDGISLTCRSTRDGSRFVLEGRRLVLAANALGTTPIVLRSLNAYGVRVPLLSNPYLYLPCVNRAMFGRPSQDARHSLGQLLGVLRTPGVDGSATASIYSYRSLLLFKLVKEMPLPPSLGVLVARLLLSSLTIVGVHFPERASAGKWMALRDEGEDGVLEAGYALDADQERERRVSLRAMQRVVVALGCVPFGAIDPGAGSSIHYAGGLHVTDDASDAFGTTHDGRLHASPNVRVADSSNWGWLPAKGLTLTLMASGRRAGARSADEAAACV